MSDFLSDVNEEAKRAREKFPSPAALLTALVEEVGEVAKAILDEPWSQVRGELVQVAAMCLRLAHEGDPTLREIREKRVHANGARYQRPEDFMPDDNAGGGNG